MTDNHNHNQQKKQNIFTPEFYLVNLMNLLILTSFNLINVLYPLKLEDIGKSESMVGFIMGTYAVAGMIFRLIAGEKSDSLGRKFFVRVGIIGGIVSAILYSLPIENTWYLLLVRIIHGASFGTYFTAAFTWIADYAPKGRLAESIGIFGISGLAAMTAGPYIGEKMLELSGQNYLYLFGAGFFLYILGLLASAAMKEYHHRMEKTAKKIHELLKNREVLISALIAVIFGVGLSGVLTFMAPYVRRESLGEVSTFFTAYAIAAITVRLISGRLADKFKRTSMLVPGFLCMALGQSFLSVVEGSFLLGVMGAVLGSAHGMIYPAMNALMIDNAGVENKGAGTGIFNASVDLGTLSGAWFLGFLAEQLGFAYMYSAAGIIIGSGLLIFYVIFRLMEDKGQVDGNTIPSI